jgi:RNase adaptor protein for sRNA GlmZ degradation
MKLVVISGRSGSGKSTALHVLEDAGFNCIDNFPVGLLPALVHNALRDGRQRSQHLAVSVDARNAAADLERFPDILLSLDRLDLESRCCFARSVSSSAFRWTPTSFSTSAACRIRTGWKSFAN